MPQSFDDIPVMMSVEMLARVTGRSEDSVRRGIRAGRIPADKVNGCWMICRGVVFRNAAGGEGAGGGDGEDLIG